MEVAIFGVILFVLLLGYYFSKRQTGTNVYVQCVEAGPTKDVDETALKSRSYYDRDIIIRDKHGAILSSSAFARLVVNGCCMSEREIYDGDELIAEKTTDSAKIKTGNIIWLYIEETGMNKIRIFDGWEGDEMKTYYFENGVRHESSRNHKVSQLRGIIRYKL